MQVQVLVVAGCPNAALAEDRVRAALAEAAVDAAVEVRDVRTPEEAEALRFRGSPTVLVDGVDPFAEPDAPVGLTCRVYRTADGLEGAPPLGPLVEALRR